MAKIQKRRTATSVPRTPRPTRPASASKAEPERQAPQAAAPALALPGGPIQHKPQAAALDFMFEDALLDGEGTCFGCVGSQRFGKSYFLKKVLARGFELGIWRRAFVHDVKKPNQPQYDGAVATCKADVEANPAPYELDPTIVFIKPAWNVKPSLQEVCQLGLTVAEDGTPVVVLADEVVHGTNGARIWLPLKSDAERAEPLFPYQMREGTSQGISSGWTTQLPGLLPLDLRALTKSVAIFQLEGDAADAACEMFRLQPEAEARKLIETLQRGQFLLFRQGKRWDRTVYGPE